MNMNIKKRFSVELAKILENSIKQHHVFFEVIYDKENYMIYLADKDEKSDFYFGIISEHN